MNIKLTSKYTDDTMMPYGEHKKEKLANVPPSYLLWLYNHTTISDIKLKRYIEDNMEVLQYEVNRT